MKPCIKCIHFDFATDEVREQFSSTSTPYEQIKKFLEKNDFEHRQKSGYISKKPLNDYQIDILIDQLGIKFTWLDDCMQQFDIEDAPQKMNAQDLIIQSAQNEMKKQFKDLQNEIEYYKAQKDTLSLDEKQKIEDKIVNLYKNLYKRKFMQAEEYKGFLGSVAKDFQIENDKKIDENARSNQLTKEQILTKKLDKEVDYYETKKSVLKPYAKLESQRKIMKLCYDLIQNDMGMSSRNYGVFQSILDERTKGKILP